MSAKKLIPLLDRVLVQKVVPPTKSVGGVLLPDSAAQKVRIVRRSYFFTILRAKQRYIAHGIGGGPLMARKRLEAPPRRSHDLPSV